MGYNTYTTDDLISDFILLSHLPISDETFDTSEIIRIATMELQLPIIKQILSSRGGYYLTYMDQAPTNDGLYPIPSDAVSGVLANVELIQDTTIIQVNQISESEQFCTTSPTSSTYGFFMRGNFVQILPSPAIGNARLWYYKRTSQLVLTTQAAQVSSIAGNVISLTSIPSTFQVGTVLDGLGDNPPFNILVEGMTIVDINALDVTVDIPPVDVTRGDWIALNGQTPVPQIPVEFRLVLVQRMVCKAYELQGYLAKLPAAKKVLEEYEKDTLGLITTRVKSQTKIINPTTGGFLSGYGSRTSNFPAGRES